MVETPTTNHSWPSDSPAQPPPRRIPTRLLFGLGLFVILPALAIGACSVWYGNPFNRAPVEAANRFLATIDSGDYQQAASMTGPCLDAAHGPITGEVLRDSFPSDIEYDLSLSYVDPIGWDRYPNATVEGTVELDGSRTQNIVLSLWNLEDDWKVCTYSLSDAKAGDP